jgi:hypothetical protein
VPQSIQVIRSQKEPEGARRNRKESAGTRPGIAPRRHALSGASSGSVFSLRLLMREAGSSAHRSATYESIDLIGSAPQGVRSDGEGEADAT